MPITLSQIKTLQHFSNANFRKFECEQCKNEFYSIRQCKYCSAACKQNAYRLRLLGEETQPQEKPQEKMLDIESPSDSKIILELDKKMKLYEHKIESINK